MHGLLEVVVAVVVVAVAAEVGNVGAEAEAAAGGRHAERQARPKMPY